MASINFNPFESWFSKPPKPFVPLNLLSLCKPLSFSSSSAAKFASLSSSALYREAKGLDDPNNPPPPGATAEEDDKEPPGPFTQMLEQFFWECENQPDYRYTPEVEAILNRDPLFEKKENPTEEEIRENERFWKDMSECPIIGFLRQAEEIADRINEHELKENDAPYRREDRKLWRSVPHVVGPDGRPMPRKAIKTDEESHDKFWDFMKQFLFGLWGFQQRPYPPGRPIDVAQAIGYKRLDDRYYDFILKSGGFYYKDRLGRTRGPCELIQLKTAWGGGIIDRNTFIWGEDLDEWVPIHMIYGMERAVATFEVRFGAAATAFIHKLQKGIPPWVPLKGFEKKTYKQQQEEAYESQRRDLAVLEANDGIWPGFRIPSHALFLWASGTELTNMLEEDHMPNKFVPKELRLQLAKVIPGLRPWEVLSIEQAMDEITYGGKWFREPLGTMSTGPPYIRNWNRDFKRYLDAYRKLTGKIQKKMSEMVPGLDGMVKKLIKLDKEALIKDERRKRALEVEELYRQIYGDDFKK